MSLKIGIIGLPNVGKSTLFSALTQKKVDISNYPFTTIDPNVGIVEVPDERLKKLSNLVPSARVFPAVIEVVDVAGLVKGAYKGEGLGNQFLGHLFAMDALAFLIRVFSDKNIVAVTEKPEEQLSTLKEELRQKDEELAERAKKEKKTAQTVQAPRLSEKPAIIVCNEKSGAENFGFSGCQIVIDGKLELELSEMTDEEKKELGMESRLHELIKSFYRTLGLITFYTIKGGKELRAWPVKSGVIALEAAGAVHTDFKEKFVRAEVIPYEKLTEAGSYARARELGWLKTEGKEYIVRDGDVIEFKI